MDEKDDAHGRKRVKGPPKKKEEKKGHAARFNLLGQFPFALGCERLALPRAILCLFLSCLYQVTVNTLKILKMPHGVHVTKCPASCHRTHGCIVTYLGQRGAERSERSERCESDHQNQAQVKITHPGSWPSHNRIPTQ